MQTITFKFPELEAINERLIQTLLPVEEIWGPIPRHFFSGKMIRPTLLILSTSFGNAPQQIVFDAGAAVEMIHLASLVHDDIIDQADTRRGKPSVHQHTGNTAAVLLGDYLFAQAFNLLAPYEKKYGLVSLATKAIAEMCQGELCQQRHSFDFSITEADYYERICQKTASLFAASCRMGALIGELDGLEIESLAKFGLTVGQAYQLLDDIVDFYDTEARAGKPVRNDLRCGVITLPVILLLQNHAYRSYLLDTLHLPLERVVPEDLDQIYHIVQKSGVLNTAMDQAQTLLKRALQNLTCLPDSPIKETLVTFVGDLCRPLSPVATSK